MRLTLVIVAALWTISVSAAEPAPASLIAELDAQYAARGGEGDKVADQGISAALKAHPGDYEVLWRASRLRWWIADGATGERLKKQVGKESWNLAERAVQANPKGVEGHYYAACGIGVYSQAIGILKALGEGVEGKFNERLDKSIALDASFERGGPVIAKGRYFFELPWPKRDLEKATELLKKAQAKHPENIRAGLYLAETLLKDGEAQEAKAVIEKVMTADIAFDPAEGRRVKQWAKRVRAQIEEELK